MASITVEYQGSSTKNPRQCRASLGLSNLDWICSDCRNSDDVVWRDPEYCLKMGIQIFLLYRPAIPLLGQSGGQFWVDRTHNACYPRTGIGWIGRTFCRHWKNGFLELHIGLGDLHSFLLWTRHAPFREGQSSPPIRNCSFDCHFAIVGLTPLVPVLFLWAIGMGLEVADVLAFAVIPTRRDTRSNRIMRAFLRRLAGGAVFRALRIGPTQCAGRSKADWHQG